MKERKTMLVGCCNAMSDRACSGRPGRHHFQNGCLAGVIFLFLFSIQAAPVWGEAKAAANPPATVASAPLTDIHDILPPVAVGIHAAWLMPLLLALTVAVLLAAIYWFWKKHRTGLQIETIIPELPPEMTAMRALDEIGDVRRVDPKAFYFRLSAILRHYISGRFTVGAPEMTTEEFLPCIDGLAVDSTLARRLKSLSRAMDPVKFGAEVASEQQMAVDLNFARAFVTQTTAATDESPDGAMAISRADSTDNGRQPPNDAVKVEPC